MVLRQLQPTDIESVTAMVAETFDQLFTAEMYLALQRAWPLGQFVMVEGGRLVGALLSMKRSETSGRVLAMVVRVSYRGMGIGSQLLRAFLRQLAIEGMDTAELEVRVSNTGAQAFYRGFGFRTIRRLPRYYPDGEDGVKMTRQVA